MIKLGDLVTPLINLPGGRNFPTTSCKMDEMIVQVPREDGRLATSSMGTLPARVGA
jgi:hypothetical protein